MEGWSDVASLTHEAMIREPMASERDLSPSGWITSAGTADGPVERRSLFPSDAEATIYRPCRSAMTSGNGRSKDWILRFERRSSPFIEPLMGYTGSAETLQQVELSFPDRQSAESYARRQSLPYRVAAHQHEETRLSGPAAEKRETDTATGDAVKQWLFLAWLNAQYGLSSASGLPDLERALISPASTFATPGDVVQHPLLPLDCKREILRRWAWDECSLERASGEGMPEGVPSRLDEVVEAIGYLEETGAPPRDQILVVVSSDARRRQP